MSFLDASREDISDHLTLGQCDRWLCLEALLIGARSLAELEEAKSLFPEALLDELLGEWAADGRYELLQAKERALPQIWQQQPLNDDSPIQAINAPVWGC